MSVPVEQVPQAAPTQVAASPGPPAAAAPLAREPGEVWAAMAESLGPSSRGPGEPSTALPEASPRPLPSRLVTEPITSPCTSFQGLERVSTRHRPRAPSLGG